MLCVPLAVAFTSEMPSETPEQLPTETARAQLLVASGSEQTLASHSVELLLRDHRFLQGTYGERPSGALVLVSALLICPEHRQRVQDGEGFANRLSLLLCLVGGRYDSRMELVPREHRFLVIVASEHT